MPEMLAAPGVGAMERVREYEELRGVADPTIVVTTNRAGLGVVFWICVAWVGVMALLAIFAGFLHLIPPNFQNYNVVNVGPSTAHLLGTDDLGRDLLSRVIYGSRVSFVIGFASVGIALVIGGTFGLLAGYAGGWIDSILNAGSLVILAFPALLAILVIEAFWKPTTLLKLTIIFAVAGIPSLFRVIRATTLSFASREFVVAARTMGATTWRILFKELLPNVIPAAVSFALIGVAVAIILEGSLAFLGLSISLPTSSLGNIINEGVQNNNLQINPLIALWPSIYIFLLLLALNLMADRLRSRFDVRAGNL
jgi:peptide/nickel transport system permease protein